jgi:hypothetical protein
MSTSAGYSLIDRVMCARSLDGDTWCLIALCLFCLVILFSDLGAAALFEPDEGRNAEVAREILLLRDRVTPHYDFIPRLDKPVFFFGLVALSFKIFGLSEWSARLPSVLAALGCLSLTYVLAGAIFGRRAALWSVLILVTSIEFFALSRVVILDMVLTFFITLSCLLLVRSSRHRPPAEVPGSSNVCIYRSSDASKRPDRFGPSRCGDPFLSPVIGKVGSPWRNGAIVGRTALSDCGRVLVRCGRAP